jgi:dienelactone hydrolase
MHTVPSITPIDADPSADGPNRPVGAAEQVRDARTRSVSSATWHERLLAAEGTALALLVGVDTPMPWPAVRATVVLIAVAAAIAVQRRSGHRTGATVRLVVGLCGLIAGAGIGVNHAMNQPVSVRTVAGVVTLAGGVVLTSLAAIDLVRAARTWRKLLALPIAVGVLTLVVAPLTLAVFVTNAPPFAAATATPADHGLAYEDVAISTADGVGLTGYYVPSANGASIIVLGGVSGFSEREIELAALLSRHGYGALLLNLRGQGDSEGDAVLWGWWGEVDVVAGVEYLANRPDVDVGRIGAIGMSVGGEQAISAAGVDHRLRAVVSEGATARGSRNEGQSAEGAGGWFIRYIDWVTRTAAGVMTSADHPTPLRQSLAAFEDQRALIISAGTLPAEIAAARAFEAAAPDAVEVWIAPAASHTTAYRTHPDEWERRVIEFLDTTL